MNFDNRIWRWFYTDGSLLNHSKLLSYYVIIVVVVVVMIIWRFIFAKELSISNLPKSGTCYILFSIVVR